MGDVMPHDDDLDVGPSDAPNVQAPLDVEEEEFLPSQPRHSRPLDTDDNDDEEFAVSLMAAAASEQGIIFFREKDLPNQTFSVSSAVFFCFCSYII